MAPVDDEWVIHPSRHKVNTCWQIRKVSSLGSSIVMKCVWRGRQRGQHIVNKALSEIVL